VVNFVMVMVKRKRRRKRCFNLRVEQVEGCIMEGGGCTVRGAGGERWGVQRDGKCFSNQEDL